MDECDNCGEEGFIEAEGLCEDCYEEFYGDGDD